MEEDWCQSVLHKDCFISSAANNCDNDMALHLSTFDPDDTFDETLSKIKMEPSDETSDYHGSSSGSPSSSLSSPNNFREDQLNIDLTLCGMFNNFSPPPGSSHSPGFGMMNEQMPQQHSPLPPVAHFSQTIHHQPQVEMPSMMLHQQPEHRYSNNNNNPNNNFGFRDSMMYEGIGGMGLAAAHLQLKSRNKMHEMAVRQRLISDQVSNSDAHQGNGDVQLSAEETRTLIQEGYDVPRSLPLSKSEEEALKIVRRKIKNKLSAQESRRKRKEYLDALEIRVQGCIQENKYLKTKIRSLEMENQDLKLKLQQVETSQ